MQGLHGTHHVHWADVACPTELLKIVATWDQDSQDDFHERTAILIYDAGHVWATAVSFAFRYSEPTQVLDSQ